MNFRKMIGLNSDSANQSKSLPTPIIYGSVIPLSLKDGKKDIYTVKQLSSIEVMGNNLLFECIEYVIKLSENSFNSHELRVKVENCLRNNGYKYENAKKQLFEEFNSHFTSTRVGLSDNKNRLLYLETLEHLLYGIIGEENKLFDDIKAKTKVYMTMNDNDLNKAKECLLSDFEKHMNL